MGEVISQAAWKEILRLCGIASDSQAAQVLQKHLGDYLEVPTNPSLPAIDPTHGADANGRRSYPEDCKVSVPVFVSLPFYNLPKSARYSYGLNEWMVDGSTGNVATDKVIEWWPIQLAGTGTKPMSEDD